MKRKQGEMGHDNGSGQKKRIAPELQASFSGPLVFQCANCKAIISDTFSLEGSDEEAGLIILQGTLSLVGLIQYSASSNVERSQTVTTSEEGQDVGCTYFWVHCKGCKAQLGKFYVTTSKPIDRFREYFVLQVSSLSCYELGRNFQQKLLRLKDMYPQQDQQQQSVSNEGRGILSVVNRHISSLVSDTSLSSSSSSMRQSGQDDGDDDETTATTSSRKSIAEVEEEILKIEHVILSLSDRIARLEEKSH